MTKLAMFNQLKSLALGLDGLFKSTGQTQVKFHQVSAAVFLTVAKKLEEFEQNYLKYHSDPVKVAKDLRVTDLNHAVEYIEFHKRSEKRAALSKIFGENLHDTSDEELDAMCDFILDVARGIENAIDDRALNNIMNNYRYVDQVGRFPSYIDDEPQRVYAASGATGNDLPRMHITHGNSPITAATYDDILVFLDNTRLNWESALHAALEQYGLNLKDALKTKNNSELFREIVATGPWERFPTCHFDIPEAVEKTKRYIAENKENAYNLRCIIDVINFLTKYENDLPTAYVLEKAKKNDYERKLAWFFGWAAHEDYVEILHAERFAWLYQNFPESGQSALDVAVSFEKREFLHKLFSITPIEGRSKFINKCMKIAAAMNNRVMCLFIHSMMLEDHMSMDSLRTEMMGHHPINECIRYNHLETLEFLLQLGVPVDVPEGEFSMDLPLAMAARFNRSDCVALLIKYGANVNAKDSTGGMALTDAITHAHWDIAKQLIQAGAVNRVNKEGKTILDLIQSEEKRVEVNGWFYPTSMISPVTPNVAKSEERIESTSVSQPPSITAIPSIWASNTTNQTSSSHDAATFTFGGSK